jgi:chromate reductase
MDRYKIAIVVGSLRKDSINRKVARSLCAMAHERLDCDIVEIGDLPLYNQDYDSAPAQPEAFVRFRNEIAAADGVLVVTPEYNRGIPGVLKNAVDVGSRPYGKSIWNQKPAAIVSASPGSIGGFGANHQLRQAAVFLNMPVMQHPDGPLKELILSLSKAFGDWVHLIHQARKLLAAQ